MLANLFLSLSIAMIGSTDLTQSESNTLVNLRTSDPVVAAALKQGRESSPTFAALAERVEQAGILVHIVRVQTLPHGMEGCLVPGSTHVVRADNRIVRVGYVRVLVKMNLSFDRLIAVLAHELQHVCEVIESGMSVDADALDQLFRRIGSPQQGTRTAEQYETAAAQRITDIVGRELQMSRSRARH
jgi:hypothetical protein